MRVRTVDLEGSSVGVQRWVWPHSARPVGAGSSPHRSAGSCRGPWQALPFQRSMETRHDELAPCFVCGQPLSPIRYELETPDGAVHCCVGCFVLLHTAVQPDFLEEKR